MKMSDIIDPSILAGDLYNALSMRHITVRRTNYYVGGRWRLLIFNNGGLFRGAPVVEYFPEQKTIVVKIVRLIGSKIIVSYKLDGSISENNLVNMICDLLIDLTK